ncbi:MAG TPA: thiamine phosphate synthase [Burkholderiales bacterium]|nr:thiamine phosphate synthase [Burkholderiales bacterium]
MRLRGLYAITPEELGRAATMARVVAAVSSGALCALQYRRKEADASLRGAEARALAQLCRRHGVPLIINDDVALALEVDAAGVHLGREDGDLASARARLPGRILGASCYDRPELARRAIAAGADYVAFGSVFPSITKPGAVRAPLTLFSLPLGVPKVAIGGITLQNAPEVVAAGADCVAVIADLFDAADVARRARDFAKIFQPETAHRP